VSVAGRAAAVLAAIATASCGEPKEPTPRQLMRPLFEGEDAAWLVYDVQLPEERGDLLQAFEASAKGAGCHTELVGRSHDAVISGWRTSFNGVEASCSDGTIQLVTMEGARVRVGCRKPVTREQCDGLLQKISESR
jgi:hypothetical protein